MAPSDRSQSHDHHHESKRHRVARIAGQLGSALTPSYSRSWSSSSSSQGNSESIATAASSATSSATSAASERLVAISRQLGGVVASSTSSPSSSRNTATQEATPPTWNKLPKFRDLPTEGGFPGCAWKVWGEGDQLGCLNLLTDAVRARAAKEEIRTGHCISLSWPLHLPTEAAFGRIALDHNAWGKSSDYYISRRQAALHERRTAGEPVEDRSEKEDPKLGPMSEDEIRINLQTGSQWDGLAHFGHLSLNCFYQGHTRKEIHESFNKIERPIDPRGQRGPALGMQAWAEKGIVGRGVLLDVWGYLQRNNDNQAPYDPAKSHAITLATLRDCAEAQGVRFRQGDILLIRTGWILRYYQSSPEERQVGATGKNGYVGVEQGEHVAEWLWDNHFAAVGCDAPAFERWPCPLGATHLHETLLAFFGMPIGEMFDLEALVEHCQRNRRWAFYFSSWPLRLFGGVASTANAGATF